MGGNSSTQRDVTIERDSTDSSSEKVVFNFSENVERRLRGLPELPDSEQKDSQVPSSLVEELQQRLKAIEGKLVKSNQENKEEYKKRLAEVEKRLKKRNSVALICEDLQQSVYTCYLENPNSTLNCSAQVQAYIDCVQKQGEKLVININRKGS